MSSVDVSAVLCVTDLMCIVKLSAVLLLQRSSAADESITSKQLQIYLFPCDLLFYFLPHTTVSSALELNVLEEWMAVKDSMNNYNFAALLRNNNIAGEIFISG